MPQDDRAQIRALLGDGVVQTASQLGMHLAQFRLPPLMHRLAQHGEPPLPRFTAHVRKAEEVEMSTRKLPSIQAGIVGEYFVAAELSRRGYVASLTLPSPPVRNPPADRAVASPDPMTRSQQQPLSQAVVQDLRLAISADVARSRRDSAPGARLPGPRQHHHDEYVPVDERRPSGRGHEKAGESPLYSHTIRTKRRSGPTQNEAQPSAGDKLLN
jgi:hypothetical protein